MNSYAVSSQYISLKGTFIHTGPQSVLYQEGGTKVFHDNSMERDIKYCPPSLKFYDLDRFFTIWEQKVKAINLTEKTNFNLSKVDVTHIHDNCLYVGFKNGSLGRYETNDIQEIEPWHKEPILSITSVSDTLFSCSSNVINSWKKSVGLKSIDCEKKSLTQIAAINSHNLLCGSSEGKLFQFDIVKNVFNENETVHQKYIKSIKLQSNIFASIDNDGTIATGDIETGKNTFYYKGISKIIQMSIDNNLLVTLNEKSSINIWDIRRRKCFISLPNIYEEFKPTHIDIKDNLLVTTSSSGIRAIELRSPNNMTILTGIRDIFNDIMLSHNNSADIKYPS